MTSNLLHQRLNTSHFAEVIEQYDPDVIVTQELGPQPADVLAAAYPNVRLRPALDFTGRGIATRLDVEFGDIAMEGRDGTSAIIRVDGRSVRLAGIHLVNPIHYPWWAAARSRRRQLDGLFAWIDRGAGPVVVAGDFNATPAWPAYKRMSQRLTDLIVDTDPKPERTWAWRPGWPRLLRIDHVFGSEQVSATEVSVVRVEGTDHAAVIADLEVIG